MTEEIETLLYHHVAQDLLKRFGRDAYDVAEGARLSLKDIGDETGEEIWTQISYTVGLLESGLASTAMH